MALIEIDGLPSYKMVMFHGYVRHNQMVPSGKLYIYIYIYMQNHHVEWENQLDMATFKSQ